MYAMGLSLAPAPPTAHLPASHLPTAYLPTAPGDNFRRAVWTKSGENCMPQPGEPGSLPYD
jgi:hypothetical protein